jgi:uncharacterized Zn-binding protein involved in type VI secretion
MPLAVTDEDGVNVSAGGFSPNPADIAASGFATITRSGGSAQKIARNGDSVQTHSNSVPVTHSGATMISSVQYFFTVNSIRVILIGDKSSCDTSHLVTGTAQQFVNVIPK